MKRCRTRPYRALSLVQAGALLFGCGIGREIPPRPVAPSRAEAVVVDPPRDARLSSFLPWAADEPEIIIVDKHDRRLALYRHGALVKTYPVVLGRNSGRKLYEGDRRTPSGVYRITNKRPHPRFDRFLAVNYPNDRDLLNYRAARTEGRLPANARPSPGGLIGIHGSDKEDLNKVGVNWTFGCVSLQNRDVEELYTTVAPGTLVLIHDDQQP